ncbi:MAG: hypothetical protein RM368_32995 [Nostoc sp. DedSLP03]|nr:hypothetical protein [Nostoc sp. DedSLP03]
MLNNGDAIAITATGLTGYLVSLRFEKCDRRIKNRTIKIHRDGVL